MADEFDTIFLRVESWKIGLGEVHFSDSEVPMNCFLGHHATLRLVRDSTGHWTH